MSSQQLKRKWNRVVIFYFEDYTSIFLTDWRKPCKILRSSSICSSSSQLWTTITRNFEKTMHYNRRLYKIQGVINTVHEFLINGFSIYVKYDKNIFSPISCIQVSTWNNWLQYLWLLSAFRHDINDLRSSGTLTQRWLVT